MNAPSQVTSVRFNFNHPQGMQQEELLSVMQNGPGTAIANLHALYSKKLYSMISLITKDRQDAEDVLQDTFVRAYLGLGSFEGRSSVYTWLSRIAINSALLVLRKRRRLKEVAGVPDSEGREDILAPEIKDTAPSPEQACIARQECLHVLKAVQKLDPKLREVLEIHLRRACSMKEIAETLDISVSAAKSRLSRARRRISASRKFRDPGMKVRLSSAGGEIAAPGLQKRG